MRTLTFNCVFVLIVAEERIGSSKPIQSKSKPHTTTHTERNVNFVMNPLANTKAKKALERNARLKREEEELKRIYLAQLEASKHTLTFSISPLGRHAVFFPLIIIITFWILAALYTPESEFFWWLGYNWSPFANVGERAKR